MARKRGIINEISRARGSFALAFLIMFILSVMFLAISDTLPEIPNPYDQARSALNGTTQTPVELPAMALEAPVRVVARGAGVDVTISNPATTNLTAVDTELQKGAIRWSESAYLGQNGTVLLFGHSSSLPIVHNRNYKAFNGIQNLKAGAVISVYSDTTEYRYSVTNVRPANAQEDVVELPTNGKFLTLVTCNNSISNKTGRYIVTAEFVEAYPISN